MYDWRKLSESDRSHVLKERKIRRFAWHAPPHFDYVGHLRFIIAAPCYEHKHVIGKSPERLAECESEIVRISEESGIKLFAWSILPNHYQILVQTESINEFLKRLGKFHGSSSHKWNGEDNTRGRQVWFTAVERSMRSDRHFYASLNYIHHNAVKHGYVPKWQDWPFSSANEYLEKVGTEKAAKIWREYPVLDYGKEWDAE